MIRLRTVCTGRMTDAAANVPDGSPPLAAAAGANVRATLRLSAAALRRRCDPAELGFATTAEVAPADGAAGQERALRAIDFAVAIPQRGYNVFATGPDGTGKRETVQARLQAYAREQSASPDVVYLFNFDESARPLCAALPPGRGRRLAHAMSEFVEHAGREIPRAFESESYRRRREEAVAPLEREHQEQLEQVRSFARSRGLDLEMTPSGLVTIPLSHGRPATPQEFERLPEDERRGLEAAGHEVEQRMAEVIPQLRDLDARARERVRGLDREVVLFAVGHLIDDVKREHGDVSAVATWLRTRARGRDRQLRRLRRRRSPGAAAARAWRDARP